MTPSSITSSWISSASRLSTAGSFVRANCARRFSISGTSGQPNQASLPFAATPMKASGSRISGITV